MESMDIRTLVLVGSATAAATALIFVLIGRPQRRVAPELLLWAAAFALKAIGLVLIYLRGRIPVVVSLPIANACIIAAMQLVLVGLDRFAGVSRLRVHALFLGVASAGLLAVHRFGTYDQVAALISLLLTTLAGALFVRVARMPRPGLRTERYVLAVIFGQETVLLGVRGLSYVLGARHATLFTPTPTTVLLYFSVILAPMLVGPALLALLGRREQLAKEQVIGELRAALTEVRTLRGLLPICASCKQIRDDHGGWTSVEAYVSHHSDARFTHSICPTCTVRLYPELDDVA